MLSNFGFSPTDPETKTQACVAHLGGDSRKPGGAREGRQGRAEKEASKASSSNHSPWGPAELTPTEVAWELVETNRLRVILPAVCGGRRAHSPAPVSS